MHIFRLTRALLALLLFMSAPALAITTISGTATYRERMALPDNAWLRVTLIDMATMTPVVGASASIPARGQVPIGFALNVHSQIENADGAYGLAAEISSGGVVLFRTEHPAPIKIGQPAPVDVLLFRAPPPPPAPAIPAAPAELFSAVWTVTSIGGQPAIGQRRPTLSIAADHRAGGFGGCNNYFTEASVDGEAISFGPAAATRMACAVDIMDQETAYFAALTAVASYELDKHGLRLLDAAGIPLIGLVRATE
jgi:putative lipoprotein